MLQGHSESLQKGKLVCLTFGSAIHLESLHHLITVISSRCSHPPKSLTPCAMCSDIGVIVIDVKALQRRQDTMQFTGTTVGNLDGRAIRITAKDLHL